MSFSENVAKVPLPVEILL